MERCKQKHQAHKMLTDVTLLLQISSDLLDIDKEVPDEDDDQEMAVALPDRLFPTMMHTTAPVDGVKVIKVPNCALSTLQAVAVYILCGGITFAFVSLSRALSV